MLRGLAGNFTSVEYALRHADVNFSVISTREEVRLVDSLIVPGVGAFRSAMEYLATTGLDEALIAHGAEGKPLLGICIGAQLLFETGTEQGTTLGLGLIAGTVLPLRSITSDLPLPHTGWNWVTPESRNRNSITVEEGYYYFNHEYFFQPADDSAVLAWADYGVQFPAAVAQQNLVGLQFHPEKSQHLGLSLMESFLRCK